MSNHFPDAEAEPRKRLRLRERSLPVLIHPEIYAWLNSQSKAEREKEKPRTLVLGTEKSNRDGPEKTRENHAGRFDREDQPHEVEYLNERKSNFNFYT